MNRKFNCNPIIRVGISVILIISTSFPAFSQHDTLNSRVDLQYNDYLKMVIDRNLGYIAEKYNLNIADANIEAAKIYQNPTMSFEWSKSNEDRSVNGNSYSTEISKTFELSRKRKARIDVAKSDLMLKKSLLADYLRNLQADATIDFLSAIKQNFLYETMLNSYLMMKKLSDADSIRYSLGSIKSIDATQSKIEAGVLLNILFQAETDRRNAFINLSLSISSNSVDTIIFPIGKFDKYIRNFEINDLITTALNNRTDLMAAKGSVAYNKNALLLTKKERKTDIDFNLGTSNLKINSSSLSATETEVYAGISIPLKFSNLNKSDIKIAQFQVEQSEMIYKQVELAVQNEVVQAFNTYHSLCKQVDNYNHGLLEQSKMVLEGKVYSYSRGETSLLEVLNAQRTYNDLQTSYYETLFNCNAALVELERATGIWDIVL